ncbi:MAG TPA: GNAT family N-acetyltransferase, partial [Candidatus Krumholzibacterium sp.]|nr:GNAT family N-acetyltransferase [Candidatus Krumholzibacterium sp.]
MLEFLSWNASSTFFHTPAWLCSLSGAFRNMETSYIVARDGSDIAGLMPVCRIHRAGFHILSSLPFGTYGTPVSGDGPVVRSILERFFVMSSSWRCVSAGANLYGIDDALSSGVEGAAEGECRVVDIGHGFAWYRSNQMSRKKRQICNGCEKEGVDVRPLVDEGELDRFYDIYREGSSSWGGVHPYPAPLFGHLFAKRAEGVVFWGAFRGGEMLGGHIDMYFGKKAQAWQAGMPRDADGSGLAGYLVYKAVE